MPRYYFDIHDSRGPHCDGIGDDLADFEEARKQCQGILPDIMRDDALHGDLHTIKCDVRDETDRIVYRGEITYQGTRDPT